LSWNQNSNLAGTHWAIDLGAEEITSKLAQTFGSPSLIAKISRLVIDYNRALESDTLFRNSCDNQEVHFNLNISPEERDLRISRYHQPYREQFRKAIADPQVQLLLSVHSFTDCYEGNKRTLEIGVLTRAEHPSSCALGEQLWKELKNHGYHCGINEPWSGEIMDVVREAHLYQKKGLGLEFRQDLLQNPTWQNKVHQDLVAIFKKLGIE
jgi:predicted N-formylglutamate amidohydrolase